MLTGVAQDGRSGPVELSEGGQAATVSVPIDDGAALTERIVELREAVPGELPDLSAQLDRRRGMGRR